MVIENVYVNTPIFTSINVNTNSIFIVLSFKLGKYLIDLYTYTKINFLHVV